ncbi:hypothetical protein [Acidianus sp. RZ1]|uniref:hypothetical protein n=1 Tax=Acidianus sp. RZ1 TaxID=1540082 RepID=UPI001491E824|nr:hypothetical protein [Acidianus sp. RZ1]NON62078.1 hypothetical protein [Acidianus sp. RZ1]
MIPKIISEDEEALEHFQFVTINGKLEVEEKGKLARPARDYRNTAKEGIRLAFQGVSISQATKILQKTLPNYVYTETAYKNSTAIVEAIKFHENGLRLHAEINKLWVASRGNKYDKGNRNIKLEVKDDYVEVRIKYPYDGSWIVGKAYFGKEYLPLLRELVSLTECREESYGVVITPSTIHVQVPIYLYLKFFSSKKVVGCGYVAGFDLNSDRLNLVVINDNKRILYKKTFWFTDVVSHGYPAERSREERLRAISEALDFASSVGVDYVVFEDLFNIRRRRFGKSRSGNRRISRFAKRDLLSHGVIKSLRMGFNVILVDAKGTTNSFLHKNVMQRFGLDRHMASAYLIALRGLKLIKSS